MSVESIKIRKIKSSEIPLIIELCALHAAYEKLPFELNGQVARLKKDLFQKDPKLYCLVAEENDKIIAYATYMKQYATLEAGEYLYLDCLFVIAEARSRGIGALLMECIKEESQKLNCSLVQWQTPSFNKRAMKFYHRIGATSKSKERFFLNT